MITLMLFMAFTTAVAASMGYVAARKRRGDDDLPPLLPEGAVAGLDDAPPNKKAAKKPAVASPFAMLPLALGDVVTGDGEERWLAGALVARESDKVIGALFFAPEGAQMRAVAAFTQPRREIYWLAPFEAQMTGEPSATLEANGVLLHRRGRLPVTFERLGQGAPRIEDGIWTEYDGGARDVALVVSSGGACHAFSGRRLEEEEYDRLGAAGEG